MKLNEKLFNNIYETCNIHTGDVVAISMVEETNLNEHFVCRSFFEQERTDKELFMKLKGGNLALEEVIKTPEQVFYSIFNNEYDDVEDDRYELIQTLENKSGQRELLIAHRTYGACAVFSISKDHNVFDLKVIDNFLISKSSVANWYEFIKLMKMANELIFNYAHQDLLNDEE